MGKHIRTTELSDTLSLSECTDGFWLWDDTRKMNLSMRAKTQQDALVSCISYYQKRLLDIEDKYNSLNKKVEEFVGQFCEDTDNWLY